MKSVGYIYIKDTRICKITYIELNYETFEFIYEPDYSVIATLKDFKGIQGINLSLKLERFVRRNMMPSFIYEHAPIGGVEFRGRLNHAKRINGLDVITFLCEIENNYFGDKLHIESK